MREEAGGLLLGPYEVGAPACYVDGPSAGQRIRARSRKISIAWRRTSRRRSRAFPLSARSASRRSITARSPIRPTARRSSARRRACKNFWLNEGHSFGVTAAGGAGWQLAEWIVEGEPTIDMLGVDPRRFGPYAQPGYLVEKNEEAYAKVFTVHYPDEERAAARPLAADALLFDRMKDLGAVFGSVYGWERPNWFAPRATVSTKRPRQAGRAAQREPSARGRRRTPAREMELPPLELF